MSASGVSRQRRRPLPIVAVAVALLLVVAFVASRTLQRDGQRIDEAEAITVAEEAAGFDADQEVVRFLRRGFQGRSHWAVALSDRRDDGSFQLRATVLVDATNGGVVQLTREQP